MTKRKMTATERRRLRESAPDLDECARFDAEAAYEAALAEMEGR